MSKFILSLLVFNVVAMAGPGHHEAVKMPKDFDRVKALVGTWEGKSTMGTDKEQDVTVTYKLISNGSAVMEHLFPGTPGEMVSIYHAEGPKVAMTHYCALGNHPKLALKKATDKTLVFEMTGSEGLTSKNEPHMHAATFTWKDPNTVVQEWVSYENGKKKEVSVFELTRKSTS